MVEKKTRIEYLKELRRRIIFFLICYLVILLISMPFLKDLLRIIFVPYYTFYDQALSYTNITDIFLIYIKTLFLFALFLSLPILLGETWLFVSPAMRGKEKKFAFLLLFFASFLFLTGILFSYFIVLPLTFKFFFKINEGFKNVLTAKSIFNFSTMMMILNGIMFETPLLVVFLVKTKLLSRRFLLNNSKWAILISFVIAAVVTPSYDAFTQTIVALPIIVLYFLGIFFSYFFEKRDDDEN